MHERIKSRDFKRLYENTREAVTAHGSFHLGVVPFTQGPKRSREQGQASSRAGELTW